MQDEQGRTPHRDRPPSGVERAASRRAPGGPVHLSVVIPTYNEASRIGESLQSMLPFLERRGKTFEILVVDDGSVDATVEVASEFSHRGVWVLELARNRGKGAALRHGVVASRGERVLLSDADLSTPIQEVERLEPLLDRADVILGSRSVEGARIEQHQPWHRVWMGKIFNLLIRALGIGDFHDTQCGFKLIRGDLARALFPKLTVDRFAWDVELIWEARRAGLTLIEVGVEWHDSPASRVRPMRDAPQMFLDVLRVRFRPR